VLPIFTPLLNQLKLRELVILPLTRQHIIWGKYRHPNIQSWNSI